MTDERDPTVEQVYSDDDSVEIKHKTFNNNPQAHSSEHSAEEPALPKSKGPDPKIIEKVTHEQKKRFWVGWQPIEKLTLILAIFTAVYAVSFLYEIYLSNRAYVYVTAISHKGIEDGKRAIIRLSINNAGHTPAHSARYYGSVEFVKYPIDINATFTDIPKDLIPPPQTTVFPSAPIGMSLVAPEPFANGATKFISPDNVARLAAWGTVVYWDVFGFKHHTNFCFLFSGSEVEAEYCPVHNDAS